MKNFKSDILTLKVKKNNKIDNQKLKLDFGDINCKNC